MNIRRAVRKFACHSFFAIRVFLLCLPIGCEDRTQKTESFRFLILSDLHVRIPGRPDNAHYDSGGNLDNLVYMVNRINADFPDAAFVVVTDDLVGTLYSDNP
ncbi:MAG: hypothetical protein ACUVWX_00910 [Kiritimatiellia bacterium]